jgi:hypothetical protein
VHVSRARPHDGRQCVGDRARANGLEDEARFGAALDDVAVARPTPVPRARRFVRNDLS